MDIYFNSVRLASISPAIFPAVFAYLRSLCEEALIGHSAKESSRKGSEI